MYGYTNQQIINDLISAANGAEHLSQSEYENRGTIGLTTVRYHFGTWNQAIKATRLLPNEPGVKQRKRKISDEELLQELVRLKQELGKPPTEGELSAKGNFSMKPYRDRWGSLRIAYKKAVEIHSEDALSSGQN